MTPRPLGPTLVEPLATTALFSVSITVISRILHKRGRDVRCLELAVPGQRESLEFHLGAFLSVCPCRCLWHTVALTVRLSTDLGVVSFRGLTGSFELQKL